MDLTELRLNKQPNELDRDIPIEVEVLTDANDYQVTARNNNQSTSGTGKPGADPNNNPGTTGTGIKVEKIARDGKKYLKVTGTADGTYIITVRATATGKEEATISWILNVVVKETTLSKKEVDPKELHIGEKTKLTINTNATDYRVEFSDPSIIRVFEKVGNIVTLEGIGIGSTVVYIRATKKYSIEKSLKFTTKVTRQLPVDKDTAPVSIQLINQKTQRTVTISTTNNNSADDIMVYLPTSSGTLVMEEDLRETTRMIVTPIIIAPANNTEKFIGYFEATQYETILGHSEEHEETIWEAYFDKDLTEKRLTYTITKYDVLPNMTLTRAGLDLGIGCFYVRVKYKSKNFESNWSEAIYVQTGYQEGVDSLKKPLQFRSPSTAGKKYGHLDSYFNGAYFGVVPHAELVDDYNFRGRHEDYKNNYKQAHYLNGRTITDVNYTHEVFRVKEESDKFPIYFPKGYQFTQDGVLYYLKKNLKNPCTKGDGSEMIVPGTNDEYWEKDTRENLATPRDVFNHRVNIGFEVPDNSIDGYSVGDGTNRAIGKLVNHAEGYIKYIYKGRLCYTTPKPIVDAAICWNDVAKVELWRKNRTVRLGGHLYYVRFMYEDEFKELFQRLEDGVYENKIKGKAVPFKAEDYWLDRTCWIYDNRWRTDNTKLALRKLIARVVTPAVAAKPAEGTEGETNYKPPVEAQPEKIEYKVTELDPKTRHHSLRLVLEWCPEPVAPYNRYTKLFGNTIPLAKDVYNTFTKYDDTMPRQEYTIQGSEKFVYDPHTDTGYFGIVPSANFYTGSQISTDSGCSNGLLTNHDSDAPGWFKFYWHGLIILITKKPIRYNCSWLNFKNMNVVYGCSLGSNESKIVTKDNIKYRVTLYTGFRTSPCDFRKENFFHSASSSNTYFHYDTGGKIAAEHMVQNLNQYSMWGELMPRIQESYEMYHDGTKYGYNNDARHHHHQIGYNWDNITFDNMITLHSTGYGSCSRLRETHNSNTYRTSDSTGGSGYTGLLYSGADDVLTYSSTYGGWRPAAICDLALELDSEVDIVN